jgi:hypothetical protein
MVSACRSTKKAYIRERGQPMSTEDAYTPFNDELDEIINANPERAAAVAEIRAEIDLATATAHATPTA